MAWASHHASHVSHGRIPRNNSLYRLLTPVTPITPSTSYLLNPHSTPTPTTKYSQPVVFTAVLNSNSRHIQAPQHLVICLHL